MWLLQLCKYTGASLKTGLKVLCCDKWVNMLLLNVMWQPKETGTFPLPPNTAAQGVPPQTFWASCHCPANRQKAGRLHWASCQSAVFLAVRGINLFSKLAPSPGTCLVLGASMGEGACWLPYPAGQKETQSSAGEHHDQLWFPALAFLTALCLSQQ